MSDNTELQNLLLQKLVASESNSTTSPSSFSTIGIIVLVTVLILVGGIIIYYIFIANLANPYPLSPFKDGQTVVIRPAILSDVVGNIENQYLTQTPYNALYANPNFIGTFMGENASALQFIGDKNDDKSQWILEERSADGKTDANQSLVYGFGNRFYLRNKSNGNPNDLAGRVRFQVANEQPSGLCGSTTPAVIGSNTTAGNYFEQELIIYFYPTNYTDTYYLLFPNCINDIPSIIQNNTTAISPNNGLVTIRPWAPLQNTVFLNDNEKDCPSTQACTFEEAGSFNPYISGTELYNNVMLMNFLTQPQLLPPYPNPNVTLFKVTLA